VRIGPGARSSTRACRSVAGSRKAFRSPNALVLNASARCSRSECRRVYILGPARRRRGLLGSGARRRVRRPMAPAYSTGGTTSFVASSAAHQRAPGHKERVEQQVNCARISLWSPRWRASDEARRTNYIPRPRRVLQLDRCRRHWDSLKDLGATRSRRKGVAVGAISFLSHAMRSRRSQTRSSRLTPGGGRR
jgi:hypothetical protein